MLDDLSHRLPSSVVVQGLLKEPVYWLQCQRSYTFQPIYRVNGSLMAIELLTAVFHPATPNQRVSPELYFAALQIPQRLNIVAEQLKWLLRWEKSLIDANTLASINIDGATLQAIRHSPEVRQLISRCPWVRFELVENHLLPQEEAVAQMPEMGLLWLDDFGSGMANFSALSGLNYGYIKLARELFILLRESKEGRSLFNKLLGLIGRYCQGVIVEGVETWEEWEQVCHSPAYAAQGYFLSRPLPFDRLESLPLMLF